MPNQLCVTCYTILKCSLEFEIFIGPKLVFKTRSQGIQPTKEVINCMYNYTIEWF